MQGFEGKGRVGEQAFTRLCDKWHYEYMQIHQGKDTMSSQLLRQIEKRPDFLVNISDVAPIFVEVKTKIAGYVKQKGRFPEEPAFGEERAKFDKMCRFESSMGLKVWYAFFEDKGRIIDQTKVYVCPLSRMQNFVPPNVDWDIYIPMNCMNECKDYLDLTNKCNACPNERRCKD